jgi:hypothetical protein
MIETVSDKNAGIIIFVIVKLIFILLFYVYRFTDFTI